MPIVNHENLTAQLVQLSQRIGSIVPYWTQGAGSNISVKSTDPVSHFERMVIKSSGFRLDQVQGESQGLSSIDLKSLLSAIMLLNTETEYSEALRQCTLDENAQRPSMEAGCHAVLPLKWVAHFHSLSALLMYDEPDYIRLLVVKNKLNIICEFIPFTLPGLELTRAFVRCISDRTPDLKRLNVYIMQNHGVILAFCELSQFEEWVRLENEFLKEKELAFRPPPAQSPNKLPLQVYFPDTALMLQKLKELQAGANNIDKNTRELWAATEWLYNARSDLATIAIDDMAKICSMPTEKFRLQFAVQKPPN